MAGPEEMLEVSTVCGTCRDRWGGTGGFRALDSQVGVRDFLAINFEPLRAPHRAVTANAFPAGARAHLHVEASS